MTSTLNPEESRIGVRPGVLCLQGASAAHLDCFRRLGHPPRSVRNLEQLEQVTHLVIPGGESTTLHHLMSLFGLWEAVQRRYRSGSLALMGTCAGAILLGKEEDGQRPPRMGLLDAVLERNAYGRQIDSFREPIELEVLGRPFHCVFIRAPRFRSVGPGARVLATRLGEPILVAGPGILASTFHPELSGDLALHQLFLELPGSTAQELGSSPAGLEKALPH